MDCINKFEIIIIKNLIIKRFKGADEKTDKIHQTHLASLRESLKKK